MILVVLWLLVLVAMCSVAFVMQATPDRPVADLRLDAGLAPPTPVPQPEDSAPTLPVLSFRPPRTMLRVVSIEPDDVSYMLDGMLSGDTSEQVGLPVSLCLARPDTPWADVAFEQLLQRWADEEALLELDLESTHRSPVVALRGEGSTIRLPLLELTS